MSKILTEISAGELLDKLSILEIKLNKIKNPALLQEIKKDYNIINEAKKKNWIIQNNDQYCVYCLTSCIFEPEILLISDLILDLLSFLKYTSLAN